MRKGEADGGRGLRLEGDITVVAGKSGGKWEIQRPGDKWLITAGERERESRSLRLPRITRETTRDGANTPRSLGRNAKLYGCETWDGDVRGCRAGCDPGNFKSCTTLCLLRKMITSVSILSVSYGLLTKIHLVMNSNFMRIYTYE